MSSTAQHILLTRSGALSADDGRSWRLTGQTWVYAAAVYSEQRCKLRLYRQQPAVVDPRHRRLRRDASQTHVSGSRTSASADLFATSKALRCRPPLLSDERCDTNKRSPCKGSLCLAEDSPGRTLTARASAASAACCRCHAPRAPPGPRHRLMVRPWEAGMNYVQPQALCRSCGWRWAFPAARGWAVQTAP